MKKCIMILIMAAMVMVSFAQEPWGRSTRYIHFDISSISGTDTTLYAWQGEPIRTEGGYAEIEVQYFTLDDTAKVAIGYSINGESFNEKVADFEMTANDSIVINGSRSVPVVRQITTVTMLWQLNPAPKAYIPIRITKYNATEGYVNIWITNHE